MLTRKRLRIAELEIKFKKEKEKKTNLKTKLVQEQLRVAELQLLLENDAKQKETVEVKSKKLEKLVEQECFGETNMHVKRRKKGFQPVERLYFCVDQQKKRQLFEKNQ